MLQLLWYNIILEEKRMSIFSFIQLFGGLAFFLFGMNYMSSSLEKMAGGRLEKLLQKVTDNKFMGLAIGAAITIAIQSSSAMTVMLVGFVNSGIMEFGQTIGVIFGSDIGTTLTAWILSLTGIESEGNIVLGLLKPVNFSLIFALVGVILFMAGKTQKKKYLGSIFLGFAVLMTGMSMMSGSMTPLAESPGFASVLTAFHNPIIGLLVGTVITGVIQSSAASIGMIQSMSITGHMTFGMAIPLVMGANIGTCMTAILSSIGVSRNAKRVSAAHVIIKIIGAVFWLVVFYGLDAFLEFSFMDLHVNPVKVAAIHTVFNILTVAILLPFSKKIEALVKRIIKDDPEDSEVFLDELLMATPAIAVAESRNAMERMIKRTLKCLDNAMDLIMKGYSRESFDEIVKYEEKVDSYEDHIGAYIVKLSTTQSLSEEDKKYTASMLQAVTEFERASDHALMIAETIQQKEDNRISFTKEADLELGKLVPALQEVYNLMAESYIKFDPETAVRIEPLRDVIYLMCGRMKETHADRLAKGMCTAEQGYLFNDLLTSAMRITGHSMNVAAIIIRLSEIGDRNSYLHDIKNRHNEFSDALYEEYYNKYYGGM